MQRLGASKITQVDFLPREMVSYSKETQTPLNAHLSEGEFCCPFGSVSKRNPTITKSIIQTPLIHTVPLSPLVSSLSPKYYEREKFKTHYYITELINTAAIKVIENIGKQLTKIYI